MFLMQFEVYEHFKQIVVVLYYDSLVDTYVELAYILG